MFIAVKIVPEQPFLSCNWPINDLRKTSKLSEFILSELRTKKPVEHNALSKSVPIKAILEREPSIVETMTSPVLTLCLAREGNSLPVASVNPLPGLKPGASDLWHNLTFFDLLSRFSHTQIMPD